MTKDEILNWLKENDYKTIDVEGFNGGIVYQNPPSGTFMCHNLIVIRTGAEPTDVNFMAYMPISVLDKKDYQKTYTKQLEKLRKIFTKSTGMKDKW